MKIKKPKAKKARNVIVRDMLLHMKGGPMKNRKDKRLSNKKWTDEDY